MLRGLVPQCSNWWIIKGVSYSLRKECACTALNIYYAVFLCIVLLLLCIMIYFLFFCNTLIFSTMYIVFFLFEISSNCWTRKEGPRTLKWWWQRTQNRTRNSKRGTSWTWWTLLGIRMQVRLLKNVSFFFI